MSNSSFNYTGLVGYIGILRFEQPNNHQLLAVYRLWRWISETGVRHKGRGPNGQPHCVTPKALSIRCWPSPRPTRMHYCKKWRDQRGYCPCIARQGAICMHQPEGSGKLTHWYRNIRRWEEGNEVGSVIEPSSRDSHNQTLRFGPSQYLEQGGSDRTRGVLYGQDTREDEGQSCRDRCTNVWARSTGLYIHTRIRTQASVHQSCLTRLDRGCLCWLRLCVSRNAVGGSHAVAIHGQAYHQICSVEYNVDRTNGKSRLNLEGK